MKPWLKQWLPRSTKLWIKEQGARILELPWTRFDVPVSLLEYLAPGEPISLIDIGASEGNFTSSVERYCGLKRAMLIEPQPKRVEELKRKFRASHFSVHCAAAAAENGSATMDVLNWDYSTSLLPIRRDMPDAYGSLDIDVREVIPVRTVTLDELCRNLAEPVDLLKIDVQGSERQVILGATETLHRVKLIWMEVSFKPLYDGSETLEGMIRLCNERGFVLRHLQEGFHSLANGELLQGDALFTRG